MQGAKAWEAGRPWQDVLWNYSPTVMKSRIVIKEFQEPKKLIIPEVKLLNYCLNKEDKIGKAKAIAFELSLIHISEPTRPY